MKNKFIMLFTTLVALILEILPYGAVCNFANPDGGPWRQTFSYFSLIPFGYANFAPFIVALLTCALFCLVLIGVFLKKSFKRTIMILAITSAVLSLAPLALGKSYFSIVGAIIFILLASLTCVSIAKE
jgi:hypothetical protein